MNARPKAARAVRAVRPARDSEDLAAWLEATGDDPNTGLCLVELLGERLSKAESPWSPEQEMIWYELARQRQIAAIEAALKPLADATFPLPAADWGRVQQIVAQCRLARDRFLHLHATIEADSPSHSMEAIDGAGNELREVLALARALDLQTRLLRTQLLHRIEVPAGDWQALARIAIPLRASSFLDEPLPDPGQTAQSMTARGLIVYPMLLWTAGLERHDQPEATLIERLARNWAGKVGLRVDQDGRLRDNRFGPTLLLGDRYSVRLDTHRIERRLDERIAILERASATDPIRLPPGLTRARCLALLQGLRQAWSTAYRPDRWPEDVDVAGALIRFGCPAVAGVADAEQAAPSAVASRAYVFGRHETDPIVRRAKGLDAIEHEAVLEWLHGGEDVDVTGRGDHEIVIERASLQPVRAGMLVSFRAHDEPLTELATLQLGVVTRRQQGGRRRDAIRSQRLLLSMWSRPARWVDVRFDGHELFDHAFLLPPIDGAPASLVTAPNRAREGEVAMLRLPRHDLAITFGAVLQRGTGFERVAILTAID